MFFLKEYYPALIFLGFSFCLAAIIFGASYILAVSDSDTEKLSSYECGFDPYEDARNAFDVRFYLVAILFIIFDLEIAFLIPWAVALDDLPGNFGLWVMLVFMTELIVGFAYLWKKGALEWD